MLSLDLAKLPEGRKWIYEVKFDGYRALGFKTGGRVQLRSRNGRNFTARFASIVREIVAYDSEGRAATPPLRASSQAGSTIKL